MIEDRNTLASTPTHAVALDAIEAGIAAAQPSRVVAENVSVEGSRLSIDTGAIDLDAFDRCIVVGGGNAAGAVGAGLERTLGDRIDEGVIITDHPVGLTRITEIEGAHPIPNESAVAGTTQLLDLVDTVDETTLVLTVLTGGGSALLPAPVPEISLDDLKSVTQALLESGVDITEMNAVRKHLSQIKGGQLARRATPGKVVGVVISDVVGNDLSVIASGPLSPDPTTFNDAINVIDDYALAVPPAVRQYLQEGAMGQHPETPKVDATYFDEVTTHILADGYTAMDGATQTLRATGYTPLMLASGIEGPAAAAGRFHAAIATEIATTSRPIEPPAAIISGGETTVSRKETAGTGGPNQECVVGAGLALARMQDAASEIVFVSVDTDGIDGNSTAAGAIVDPTTITDDHDAKTALKTHDVTPYLRERNAVLQTRFTTTNVNDLRILVIDDPSE